MSNYVNNLNELINTKNEFKEIIIESGQTPGEVFSYYPDMIRNAIAAGGGSLVDYPTYTYVATYYPDFTYLFSYVGDALSGIDVDIDLSSYVTKDELSAQSYVTYSYVSNNYVKKYETIVTPDAKIGNLSIENELKVNANTYSYNIIPQENNTYTLGDSSHLYSATYTSNIYLSEKNGWENVSTWQTRFKLDGSTKYYLTSNRFYPGTNESASLGLSNQRFLDTYTTNLYSTYIAGTTYVSSYQAMYFGTDRPWCLYGSGGGSNEETILTNKSSAGKWFRVKDYYGNNILGIYELNSAGNKIEIPAATYITNIYTENVSYASGKSSIKMNDRNIDIYANNKKMINLSDYNGLVPIQTNVNLGGSANKWSATYTTDLYADTIHNFIWTGTSAQYAALDNYTSYQIYLIKES